MSKLFYAEHRENPGTAGGGGAGGFWDVHTINTELVNEIGAVLASNQITLLAGTYEVEAYAPFFRTAYTQMRFQNITDALTEIWGTGTEIGSKSFVAQTLCHVFGVIVIAGTKTFELQWRSTSGVVGLQMGSPVNGYFAVDRETYLNLWIKLVK